MRIGRPCCVAVAEAKRNEIRAKPRSVHVLGLRFPDTTRKAVFPYGARNAETEWLLERNH